MSVLVFLLVKNTNKGAGFKFPISIFIVWALGRSTSAWTIES